MYVKTDRLTLRPMSADSLEALTDLLTDEIVKRGYMVPDFPSREAAGLLARKLVDLSHGEDSLMLGIYRGDTFLGLLNETESQGDRIELGYALLPRYHNQGYGTEALRAAIGLCFDRGYREVTAGAFEENRPSIRVMTKAGMTKQDRRDTVSYAGREYTCVYYAIRRREDMSTDGCYSG